MNKTNYPKQDKPGSFFSFIFFLYLFIYLYLFIFFIFSFIYFNAFIYFCLNKLLTLVYSYAELIIFVKKEGKTFIFQTK